MTIPLNHSTTQPPLPLSPPLQPPPTPPIRHYSHGFEHRRQHQHNILLINKHSPCVNSRSRPRDRRLYNYHSSRRKEWIPGPTPRIQHSLGLCHSQPFAIRVMLLSLLRPSPYKHLCALRTLSITTPSSHAETTTRMPGKNKSSLHPKDPSVLEHMLPLRREMRWLQLQRIGRERRRTVRIGGFQTEG